MPKTRQQKEEQVIRLTEQLQAAKSVVFADYKGLTMSQLSQLRNQLSEVGGKLSVTKNNLLKISLQSTNYQLPTTLYEGPIATLIASDDEIAPIKVLVKALKDFQIGKVKAGILEGEVLDEYKLVQLANLPTKDELRAKVVGSLGAPLYGIVGVLQANIRNLVYALDQVRIMRGGE
ncbi:MAG: hypothetical protein ACD_30C00029G0009 [uncultured bacterium]|uniref:Large ribosomal subunit protein uL10 n=2 Tax=Candidatus Daviesiibacteriota TaxID=1752718 RepID=A0A0G0ESF1_9BACT|nr:MAG: hypothetical protein ACD_30C00029G0009 [uncultured bacterium]KKQ09798.1 MAG: 50S ribosomal protein L10 [Candidatus Daviesbacteria bacterium GW2011_GWB1_36_5]OGE32384.1 MAG: 50S ribosomal protein L10 [Candidatus Daviesbacteria bacterium RIFCSPHIGHO2_02_FULL_37_9]OGE35592.1 MAG: 50S ribosomal protein L10 [Candidatus Daviesbacteria bacterium RIFCSPHIGHO2_12_FULL_37_16]